MPVKFKPSAFHFPLSPVAFRNDQRQEKQGENGGAELSSTAASEVSRVSQEVSLAAGPALCRSKLKTLGGHTLIRNQH